MSRGRFITFEGPDGSGKSTQMRLLAQHLRDQGRDVLESQEPGGTPIGMHIRRILLDPENSDLSPTAEMLLMFAARAQNVDQWILPALAQGRIVLSDRFTDSTLVYQGTGRGLGAETVYEVDRVACRGLVPDLTFVIDIDTEAGLSRARRRNQFSSVDESRIDEQALSFHKKVREAYQRLATDEPRRVRLIDGSLSKDQVAAEVWSAVRLIL